MNRPFSLVLTVAAFLVCARGSQALPSDASEIGRMIEMRTAWTTTGTVTTPGSPSPATVPAPADTSTP
jgi:hypothetical protein